MPQKIESGPVLGLAGPKAKHEGGAPHQIVEICQKEKQSKTYSAKTKYLQLITYINDNIYFIINNLLLTLTNVI